jgi:hypothetical protein
MYLSELILVITLHHPLLLLAKFKLVQQSFPRGFLGWYSLKSGLDIRPRYVKQGVNQVLGGAFKELP